MYVLSLFLQISPDLNQTYIEIAAKTLKYPFLPKDLSKQDTVKYDLKRAPFGSKECIKDQWPSNSFKVPQWNPWSQKDKKIKSTL